MFKISQVISQLQQMRLFSLSLGRKNFLEYLVKASGNYFFNYNVNFFPIALAFSVTHRCNLNCKMCNYALWMNSNNSYEMNLLEIENFLKTLVKKKPYIYFCGGEPFIKDDFIGILEIAKNLGFKFGINTNGTLLDEDIVSRLSLLQPEHMIFSLHGPKKVHDEIVGLRGAYDKLIYNMKSFVKKKWKQGKVIITSAINKYNIDFLKEIVLVGEECGVDLVRFENLNFLTKSEVEQKLVNSEYAFKTHIIENKIFDASKVVEKIKAFRRGLGKYKVPISLKPYLSDGDLFSWYACDGIKNRTCYIPWSATSLDPSGNVIPCHFIDYSFGNIREELLFDIWNNRKYCNFRKAIKSELPYGCRRCCKI